MKLPYSLNVISEEAAIWALENPSYRDANVQTIVAERERVLAALATIGGVEPFPTRANFVTFRCIDRRAGELFAALCADDILIRDVSGYPGLSNCLRVSIGTTPENERFLTSLRNILEDA